MSSTNPKAPDQRREPREVLMTRTLEALMAADPDASAERVLEMLTMCVPLDDEYRCLNPTCTNLIAWPTDKGLGRPKLFCSKGCRQAHDRVRARLHAELESLIAVRERPGVTKRQREKLSTAIGQRQWALARFVEAPAASVKDHR